MADSRLEFRVEAVAHATQAFRRAAEAAWWFALALMDAESREWYMRVASARWVARLHLDGFNEASWWRIRQSTYAARWQIGQRTGQPAYLVPSRELALREPGTLA